MNQYRKLNCFNLGINWKHRGDVDDYTEITLTGSKLVAVKNKNGKKNKFSASQRKAAYNPINKGQEKLHQIDSGD